MKRIFRTLFPVFFLAFITACAGNGQEPALMEQEGAGFSRNLEMSDETSAKSARSLPAPAAVSGENLQTQQDIPVADPKIIREGGVSFETSDLKQTRTLLDTLVTRYEAYLANDDQYKFDDRIEQRLVIRVPADNFDSLVHELEGSVERFDSRTISARDVTEEFMDVSLRIRIKKETEQRYRDILTKAETVRDILEVERYIGRIRSEIESLEGRLNYLQNRISFSTLTVTFYQLKSESVGLSSRFTVALNNGWNNFMLFLLGIVSLWPFLVAGLILLFILLVLAGRRKSKIQQ